MSANVEKQVAQKLHGRFGEIVGQFWSILGVVTVTEEKLSYFTRSLILVSITKKLLPTKIIFLEPMVVLWMWLLYQV